jgi:hypothetical protein
MTVLTFIAYYLPACKAGGAVRSVANLVECFGDEFDFRVVTSDRDSGDSQPFPGVSRDTWVRLGKALVRYLGPEARGYSAMAELIREIRPELLYLNSYHSLQFTTVPLALHRFGGVPRMPVVLAPRGEFSIGALGIKAARKKLYRAAARATGLYRARGQCECLSDLCHAMSRYSNPISLPHGQVRLLSRMGSLGTPRRGHLRVALGQNGSTDRWRVASGPGQGTRPMLRSCEPSPRPQPVGFDAESHSVSTPGLHPPPCPGCEPDLAHRSAHPARLGRVQAYTCRRRAAGL